MRFLRLIHHSLYFSVFVGTSTHLVCQGQGTTTRPKAVASLKVAPEEYLLKVGRERKANILVDSTSISAAKAPDSIDPATRGPQGDIANVLGPIAQSLHLSSQQLLADTFLYWNEPDEHQIAQAIARGEGFGAEQGEAIPAELRSHLLDYLHPNRGLEDVAKKAKDTGGVHNAQRDQRTKGDKALQWVPIETQEIALSQLPNGLQQQIVALVANRGINAKRRDYAELWLQPEVWQKARIVYQPDDPKITFTYKTFIAQVVVETGHEKLLLSIDTFDGGTDAQEIVTKTATVIGQPDEAKPILHVLSATEPQADVNPFLVNDVLRPQGAALKALEEASGSQRLADEADLATPVSLDATRQPLRQFLAEVAKQSKVALQLPDETLADNTKLLISAHVQDLPLLQLMEALSHLYARKWNKNGPQNFSLVPDSRSALSTELLKVGNFQWYKFRENNGTARRQRKADFDQFGAKLVDEAGDQILVAPGVAFKTLSPEFQTEIREAATARLERSLVMKQAMSRDLVNGKWSFRFVDFADDPRKPFLESQLVLLIDGQPKLNIRLRDFHPRV